MENCCRIVWECELDWNRITDIQTTILHFDRYDWYSILTWIYKIGKFEVLMICSVSTVCYRIVPAQKSCTFFFTDEEMKYELLVHVIFIHFQKFSCELLYCQSCHQINCFVPIVWIFTTIFIFWCRRITIEKNENQMHRASWHLRELSRLL